MRVQLQEIVGAIEESNLPVLLRSEYGSSLCQLQVALIEVTP